MSLNRQSPCRPAWTRTRHFLMCGAALLTFTSIIPAASAQDSRPTSAYTRSFRIPAGDAAQSLNELARQAEIQIVFPYDAVRGKSTPAVNGTYTPSEALNLLTADLDLLVTTGANGVVTLAPRANAPAIPVRKSALEPGANGDLLEEIVVTGTYIRGSHGVGTNVITIDRAAIDRAGFATARDIIRSLPQNSRGGVAENTVIGQASSNFTSGSAVNLRGLGTDSTLVLVDGRRIPVAGIDANFADISSIPAGAIERVEVLPDGASAIYGADAVAGVVNFIMRTDYEGAETKVRYGSVTDGGLRELTVNQTFGTAWTGGNALLSYEHYEQKPLPYSDRSFTRSADLRPLGGDDFRGIYSSPGNILDNNFQPLYAVPKGQDGRHLTNADLLPGQINRADNKGATLDTFARQNRDSAYAKLNQDITEGISAFAEGRYSERNARFRSGPQSSLVFVPASNPFFVDPFNRGFTYIAYDFTPDLGEYVNDSKVKTGAGVVGGSADLFSDWQLRVYAAYSEERSKRLTNGIDMTALSAALADPNPATAFNPFGDGSFTNAATLAGLRAISTMKSDSWIWSGNAIMDGTLFTLPGGAVKLAVGADYRMERLDFSVDNPGFSYYLERRLRRDVTAFFGEMIIPVVGTGNSLPGIERLTLSVAGRHESYEDEKFQPGGNLKRDPGSTTNPKVGLEWVPVNDLTLRAAYGKSFRAPNLPTLGNPTNAGPVVLDDPTSPTGHSAGIYRQGVDDNLRNEKSKNWTFGLNVKPEQLPGFTFDASYFGIRFKDRISTPSAPGSVLFQEDRYRSIITRNPTQAQIDAVCDATFQGDRSVCVQGGIAAIIDGRLINIATSDVDGIDANVAYGFDSGGYGRFDATLGASYILNFKESFGSSSAVYDLVDTVHHPIDLVMRGSLTWTGDQGLSVTGFVTYQDSYTDDVSTPNRKIDSHTTFDLAISYDTAERFQGGWMRDWQVSLNVQNVFDKDPPFVNNPLGMGYDPENADPRGRFISLGIARKW